MENLQPFKSDYLPVTNEVQPLNDVACKAILLHASSVLKDGSNSRIAPNSQGFKTLGNEIFWGVGGYCVNQLFVSESSILIPVSNANQIGFYSLNPTANQILSITYFK